MKMAAVAVAVVLALVAPAGALTTAEFTPQLWLTWSWTYGTVRLVPR